MLRIFGIGALVAGGLVVALAALIAVILIGPLIFWVAWNLLDFASAVGLPLGFWGIVLATLFLVVGWFGSGDRGDRLPRRAVVVRRCC